MKRFAFSLEKILSLREFREKEARLALGRAISTAERIRNDLDQTSRDQTLGMRELSAANDTNTLTAIQNYLLRLDVRRDTLLNDLARAELEVQEKRALFADAMKNRKALTNLREKRAAQWRQAQEREESLVLDEIGSRSTAVRS
jgi:flagellar FliJ protein